jgi:hypothetical protein
MAIKQAQGDTILNPFFKAGLSGRRPTRDPQRHLQKNRLKLASEAANRGISG